MFNASKILSIAFVCIGLCRALQESQYHIVSGDLMVRQSFDIRQLWVGEAVEGESAPELAQIHYD